jgi:maltose O-acetyltransferase
MFRKVRLLFFLFALYIANYFINKIPFYCLRHFYYKRLLGIKLGKGSSIHLNCFLYGKNIKIGNNTTINRRCFLDGRGNICIGNNVSISPEVFILTDDHIVNSKTFEGRSRSVFVDDYVWIGSRALILPSVYIGKGAVISAGAVVTKNVEPYTVVAGIPATKIAMRSSDLEYSPSWTPFFD